VTEYWINVCYLTSCSPRSRSIEDSFWLPTTSRTTNYGFAVIEALVLAKVIMIGEVARLGRGLERKPLIYPTLYKTVVFHSLLSVSLPSSSMGSRPLEGRGVHEWHC